MQIVLNPLTDDRQKLLGTMQRQIRQFSSLSIFRVGCKTIIRRAGRRMIVLGPKQCTESEPNLQSCYILWRTKMPFVR